MDISNKTVLVVGTGKSGVAAAKLLLHHAKKVYIQDGNEALDVAAFRSKNPELTPVELILGDVSEDMLKSFDIAVLSPGVPLDIPLVEKMKTLGMTIWGEIELAYVLGKGHVVAITGTNGKTTTTTLVGQIMARHFAHVAVVGNIGIPYTSVAEETTDDTVVVAEIIPGLVLYDTLLGCNLKYHAGSSEPPSYHGKLYCRQGEYRKEPDQG